MADVGIDLGRNEKVLWTGAPRQGLVLRGADATPVHVDDIFDPGKVKALVESFIGAPTDRAEGISNEIGRAIDFTKRPDTMAYADGARVSVLGLDLGVSSF